MALRHHKGWNSSVYHACSNEERQLVDPDCSLTVSCRHSGSACAGLLLHQRFNRGNMRYSPSRIFPTLGLLESGRTLSNDHLRLSTAFPLREAKWGAPRCFPQLPKCLGLASSTESNCDRLCKLVPSGGHRYHDLKMSLNRDTQVLAMKGQSDIPA